MMWLAAPVLLEQLLLVLVGFSDTLLTGHYLEKPHLAAINLMAYALWLLFSLFAVVSIGATAMVARFVGAGDSKLANRVVNQAFLLGSLLALLATIGGLLAVDRLVLLMQLQGESAALAAQYLKFVIPILPLIMIETVGIACLRGAGDMITGLVVMAIVNIVNVSLSWAFVLGPGPIPKLGWQGIALGTMCGYLAGGLLVAALLIRGRAGLRVHWRWLKPDIGLIRRLLRIGLPGGADTLAMVGCQLWFVAVINQLGDLAAAAHGVAIRIESLAFLPGSAFAVAATTMAGQYLGAGDHRKAGRSVLMACLAGGGLMTAAAIVFYLQAPYLARLFVRADQIEVAQQAAPLLRIISLGVPALALAMILTGALRGAGDTRWPLVFSMIGLLGVRLPGAYWLAFETIHIPGTDIVLAGWGLGVIGAWYAMTTDLWVRALLVSYRFLHGGWKRVKV